MSTPATASRLPKALPYILSIGSVIGLICSYIISLDKVKLLQNPGFQPSCDLNPIVACGSVMRSAQGSVFGFPNPWIGLVSFGVLLTIGVGIWAGAQYKRWFWLGLQAGTVLGMAFAYWLLFESIYRIHALCPYCLTVDIVVTTIFWYVLLYNIETKAIRIPKSTIWSRVANFMRKHHVDLLILWFIAVIILILQHFWYYFGSHL